MRIILLLNILLIVNITSLLCQNSYIISGRITDSITREPLIGTTIQIDNTYVGNISNEQGYFTIKTKEGKHELAFSNIGYEPQTIELDITKNTRLSIALKAITYIADEIIVTADNKYNDIETVESGTVKLQMKDIKKLPALMGETDFIRIIQLLPGIQSANDANMGFYVRGGGADQNLILIDNITVYNPSHVLGFFSVFNSDAIRSTKLIKSGMPANYGGRLSSVIDIQSQDGDFNKFGFKGNIGLISSKALIQGPILKEKLSFIVAARKSYIDEILKPIIQPFVKGSSTFFQNTKYTLYDLNAQLTWNVANKHTIKLTSYSGNDNFSLEKQSLGFKNKMIWGNKLISVNWINKASETWLIRTTFGFTQYIFDLKATQQKVFIGMNSKVEEYSGRTEFINSTYAGSIIKAGGEYKNYSFQPNNLDVTANNLDLNFGSNRTLKAHEASVFYSQENDISEKIRINVGIRATTYLHVGPYYRIKKNEIGEITDSTYYHPGEIIKPYYAFEPRISARYNVTANSSVKLAATFNKQFIHMVSPSTVTLPTDVWLPSTNTVKPQEVYHYSAGYFKYFLNKKIDGSINIYYKKFNNQIELLHGIVNNFQDNVFEESVALGHGSSCGVELHIEKNYGKLNGWIAYTLSKTTRQFDKINNGAIYPAKYDRKHDLNLVATYDLNEKWSFSGTFILASGNALTLPEYKYILDGNVISGYSEKNSFRMPTYHRLDLSVTYYAKKTAEFESAWNLSVYNLYNRANPFYIYFEVTGNVYEYNLRITPVQVSVFPIIPAISWSYKF